MKEKNKIIEEEKTLGDNLELAQWLSRIHTKQINKNITEDFILAKLDDQKDKKMIIEMTKNAYYSQVIMSQLAKTKIWKWDKEKKDWTQENLNKTEQEYIKSVSEKIFLTYMIRPKMLAILNRNVDKNFIIEIMSGMAGGHLPEREIEEAKPDLTTTKAKITNLLKPEKRTD